MTWEKLYDLLGIRDFIYFISSPYLQDILFPVKIVFIFFTAFFFVAVIYFYINSSYIQYQFLQDVTEFFSWQAYGTRDINKRWKKIIKKTESGLERDYKLAIMEADSFLEKTLEDMDYKGETFEEMINNVSKRILPNEKDILEAHNIRNTIVHDPDYRLDLRIAKKILENYERLINNISVS